MEGSCHVHPGPAARVLPHFGSEYSPESRAAGSLYMTMTLYMNRSPYVGNGNFEKPGPGWPGAPDNQHGPGPGHLLNRYESCSESI